MSIGYLKETTVYNVLVEQEKKTPEKTAYIFPAEEKEVTYKELLNDVNRAAKALLSLSIGRDSKVAVWSTNSYAYVILMFATSAIGAMTVPINTNYKKNELLYALNFSDTNILFYTKEYRKNDFEEKIFSLKDDLNFKHIYITNHEKNNHFPNFDDFLSLSEKVSEDDFSKAKSMVTIDDIFCLQFTSGTTGRPKGALLSNFSAINVGRQFANLMVLNATDVLITPLPLFHCFGNIDVLLSALCAGVPLVLMNYFSPLKVLDAIEKYKCTSIYAVPTMLVAMYEHEKFNNYDVSSLNKGVIGGSVCLPKVSEDISERFGAKAISIGYGTTETCALAIASYCTDRRYNRMFTCGKVLDFMECKIVNPDTYEECYENIPGELLIKGYNLMKGYYKDKEATDKVIDSEGWYHTGDMAIREHEGLIRITGRYKDIIIRGGENISPSEIESEILTLDGITAVEVVGIKDEKYGEEIAAFIVADRSCKYSDSDIREHVRNTLAHYKVPKYIFYVDDYPKTASGKIQKYLLARKGEKILGLYN